MEVTFIKSITYSIYAASKFIAARITTGIPFIGTPVFAYRCGIYQALAE